MAETRVHAFLDFEKPIAELEGKIEELRHLSDDGEISIVDEVEQLQTRVDRQLDQTYSKLSPWQKVQVARHPGRPHCLDYVRGLITSLPPLPVIAVMRKTTPLSAASAGSNASPSSLSGRKKATIPNPA